MALKATIYKADLSIADMDRNYYQEHALSKLPKPPPPQPEEIRFVGLEPPDGGEG